MPTLLRFGLRLLGLLLATFALWAMYYEFIFYGVDGVGDAVYVTVVCLLFLWTALLLVRSGASQRDSALRARRRLGWTLCLLAAAVTLLALVAAGVNIASGVPVPEVMRPIGLTLISGTALLAVGRWTLRHASSNGED